jgi:hypothetical protein
MVDTSGGIKVRKKSKEHGTMVPVFVFTDYRYGSYQVMCRNLGIGCGALVCSSAVLICRDGLTAVKI